MPEQMFQSDFVNRADAVTNLHINHVRQATADLNAIMASLKQATGVSVPPINVLAPESEPAQVNFIPSKDVVAVFADDYKGVFSDLKTWLSDLKTGAIETFFPYAALPAGDEADDWLIKAIRGEAIQLAEDAELGRGRTRAWEEASRAKKIAAAGYSALGYILPPGALLAAQQEADYAAGRAVFEINRDITIESQKLRIQMVQFAVGQVNSLRQVAAAGLTGYLNAFTSLPNTAVSYAAQKEKAQEGLWDAGRQYYASQLAFKNTLNDIKKANQQAGVVEAQLSVGIQEKQIERDLKSLQTAAEVYGRLVAGAMAGINSHISLGANSNANTNYQLNGTYP